MPDITRATITALICSVLVLPLAVAAETKDPPSITVTGTGESQAQPDAAQIHAGVVTQAPRAAEALAENNERIRQLLDLLTGLQIPEKDIQTSQFSVSPRYEPLVRGRERRIAGYDVSNQLRVKVRDIGALGNILDTLVRAGSNELRGIQFSVDDPTALMDEARRAAIADARRKAMLLARSAGTKLGKILRIQEGSAPQISPRTLAFAQENLGSAVPITPGTQQFRVTVTVTYAIHQP